MTYFHYYATTSRNLDRVLQYAIYPAAEIVGFLLFRGNRDYTQNFARVVSSACYASLTATFFGLESSMIDANGREAVSAATGIDPDKISFSDYKSSSNIIIRKAYEDIIGLQPYRLGTDMLFMAPIGVEWIAKACGVQWMNTKQIQRTLEQERRDYDHGNPISWGTYFANGTHMFNYSVYAGKAGYWAYETYKINKSSHYEIVKLRETLESTGKDMNFNDLLAVYQRARNDRGLPMISKQEEYDALRPLLNRVAAAYNKRDGVMDMAGIVYLIGENKINIHGPDNKTLSSDAISQSMKDIEHVAQYGLVKLFEINKEKRQKSVQAGIEPHIRKGFVDKLADGAFNIAQKILGDGKKGLIPHRPEEFISVRDPGELVNWNHNVGR